MKNLLRDVTVYDGVIFCFAKCLLPVLAFVLNHLNVEHSSFVQKLDYY